MIKTKIYFGNDHAGENLKNYLINRLDNKYKNKYIIKDFGCNNQNKADFPIYAEKVCKSITVKPLKDEYKCLVVHIITYLFLLFQYLSIS